MIQQILHRSRSWLFVWAILGTLLIALLGSLLTHLEKGSNALQTTSAFAATSAYPCHKPGGCPVPTPTPISPELPPGPIECIQIHDQRHCDNQNPITQGCLADAQTKGSANIYDGNVIVGHVDRRFSPKCQSYWIRTFNYSQNGKIISEFVGHDNVTSVGDNLEEYTNMIYIPPTSAIPTVRGSLSLVTSQVNGVAINYHTVSVIIQ